MRRYKSLTILWSAVWLLLAMAMYAVAGAHRLGLLDFETAFINDIFPYIAILSIDLVLIPLLFVISYYAKKAQMTGYTKFLRIMRGFFLIYLVMSIIILILLGLGVGN